MMHPFPDEDIKPLIPHVEPPTYGVIAGVRVPYAEHEMMMPPLTALMTAWSHEHAQMALGSLTTLATGLLETGQLTNEDFDKLCTYFHISQFKHSSRKPEER